MLLTVNENMDYAKFPNLSNQAVWRINKNKKQGTVYSKTVCKYLTVVAH